MSLSEAETRRFEDYIKRNCSIFSDRVIESFFQNEENIELLLLAIDGNLDSLDQLNENFRKHFFRIRFTKYLISIIHTSTLDQIRRNYKNKKRNQLIFDRPVSDKDQTSLGECLLYGQAVPRTEPES